MHRNLLSGDANELRRSLIARRAGIQRAQWFFLIVLNMVALLYVWKSTEIEEVAKVGGFIVCLVLICCLQQEEARVARALDHQVFNNRALQQAGTVRPALPMNISQNV